MKNCDTARWVFCVLTFLQCCPPEACCLTSDSPPWDTEKLRRHALQFALNTSPLTESSHGFASSHSRLYFCCRFPFFGGGGFSTALTLSAGVLLSSTTSLSSELDILSPTTRSKTPGRAASRTVSREPGRSSRAERRADTGAQSLTDSRQAEQMSRCNNTGIA